MAKKKQSRKRAAGARPRPRTKRGKARPDKIELRPIRTQLTAHVNALSDKISKAPGAQPELEEALKRMSRFLADIQDICGPDMMIPL